MGFSVRILGTSSATPTLSRHPSAQLLNVNERLFLIDCGEGTQMQFRRYKIRHSRVNHIFISHLHGDHYLGLVGLLFTMHLFGRKAPLHLYGNPELMVLLEMQFRLSDTVLLYPLIFHPLNPGETSVIFEDTWLQITAFPLMHRVPTHGFVFREKTFGRRISKAAIASLSIPADRYQELRDGKDIMLENGALIKNSEVTTAPRKALSFAYCSDTGYTDQYLKHIKDVDVLYHEATFMVEKEAGAREKMHSTTQDAARIALQSGAKRLIIGHYSARYDDLEPVLAETRALFPESYLAEEGLEFMVSE